MFGRWLMLLVTLPASTVTWHKLPKIRLQSAGAGETAKRFGAKCDHLSRGGKGVK